MAQNEGERPKVELIHPAELVKAPPVPVPGIKVEANVYVTMRDGVKLAVDVYLPEQDGKYPALLSLALQQGHSAQAAALEPRDRKRCDVVLRAERLCACDRAGPRRRAQPGLVALVR